MENKNIIILYVLCMHYMYVCVFSREILPNALEYKLDCWIGESRHLHVME